MENPTLRNPDLFQSRPTKQIQAKFDIAAEADRSYEKLRHHEWKTEDAKNPNLVFWFRQPLDLGYQPLLLMTSGNRKMYIVIDQVQQNGL